MAEIMGLNERVEAKRRILALVNDKGDVKHIKGMDTWSLHCLTAELLHDGYLQGEYASFTLTERGKEALKEKK